MKGRSHPQLAGDQVGKIWQGPLHLPSRGEAGTRDARPHQPDLELGAAMASRRPGQVPMVGEDRNGLLLTGRPGQPIQ